MPITARYTQQEPFMITPHSFYIAMQLL